MVYKVSHFLVIATKFKTNKFWISAANFCTHISKHCIQGFIKTLTKLKGPAAADIADRKQNNQSMESIKLLKTTKVLLKGTSEIPWIPMKTLFLMDLLFHHIM